jgi:hypothetical protein
LSVNLWLQFFLPSLFAVLCSFPGMTNSNWNISFFLLCSSFPMKRQPGLQRTVIVPIDKESRKEQVDEKHLRYCNYR